METESIWSKQVRRRHEREDVRQDAGRVLRAAPSRGRNEETDARERRGVAAGVRGGESRCASEQPRVYQERPLLRHR